MSDMTPGWLTGSEFTSAWISVGEENGSDLAESDLPVRVLSPDGDTFEVTDIKVDEQGIWITGEAQ